MAVVGSVNLDLIVRSAALPRPGETVRGRSLTRSPGGKGANQAVAAARAGGQVRLIAAFGDDADSRELKRLLSGEGVDLSPCLDVDEPGGSAVVQVDDDGENAITVIPGSNARLDAAAVRSAGGVIRSADVLLVQLETPTDGVAEALRIAREADVRTVLDPAPAGPLDGLLPVDVLCPNESEAAAILGRPVEGDAAAEGAVRALSELGVGFPVLTRGAAGATLLAGSRVAHVPAPAVEAVDTTAAGDAFAGALAVGLASGEPLAEAVRVACGFGTLTAAAAGAWPAIPNNDHVRQLLDGDPA